jgi:hypothetical protein
MNKIVLELFLNNSKAIASVIQQKEKDKNNKKILIYLIKTNKLKTDIKR